MNIFKGTTGWKVEIETPGEFDSSLIRGAVSKEIPLRDLSRSEKYPGTVVTVPVPIPVFVPGQKVTRDIYYPRVIEESPSFEEGSLGWSHTPHYR